MIHNQMQKKIGKFLCEHKLCGGESGAGMVAFKSVKLEASDGVYLEIRKQLRTFDSDFLNLKTLKAYVYKCHSKQSTSDTLPEYYYNTLGKQGLAWGFHTDADETLEFYIFFPVSYDAREIIGGVKGWEFKRSGEIIKYRREAGECAE